MSALTRLQLPRIQSADLLLISPPLSRSPQQKSEVHFLMNADVVLSMDGYRRLDHEDGIAALFLHALVHHEVTRMQ